MATSPRRRRLRAGLAGALAAGVLLALTPALAGSWGAGPAAASDEPSCPPLAGYVTVTGPISVWPGGLARGRSCEYKVAVSDPGGLTLELAWIPKSAPDPLDVGLPEGFPSVCGQRPPFISFVAFSSVSWAYAKPRSNDSRLDAVATQAIIGLEAVARPCEAAAPTPTPPTTASASSTSSPAPVPSTSSPTTAPDRTDPQVIALRGKFLRFDTTSSFARVFYLVHDDSGWVRVKVVFQAKDSRGAWQSVGRVIVPKAPTGGVNKVDWFPGRGVQRALREGITRFRFYVFAWDDAGNSSELNLKTCFKDDTCARITGP